MIVKMPYDECTNNEDAVSASAITAGNVDAIQAQLMYDARTLVVCFCGKMGVGKTTTARYFQERLAKSNITSKVVSFASALKQEASVHYGFDISLAYTQEGKRTEVEFNMSGDDEYLPESAIIVDINRYKDTVRNLLQWYAQRKRMYDSDYWVKSTAKSILLNECKYDVIIVDDGRYPNEVEMVNRFKYHLVLHLLPYDRYDDSSPACSHISEHALDNFYIPETHKLRYGKFYLRLFANAVYNKKCIYDFITTLDK